MSLNKDRKPLGRGLSSLLQPEDPKDEKQEGFKFVNVDLIDPNPYQPRQSITTSSIMELSESIKEKGVIVPITVVSKGDRYILAAGERRLSATRLAGFKDIPAVVKDLSDKELAEVAIIENVHRKDLNPIEEGYAYLRLLAEFEMSTDEIAEKVSKTKSYVDGKLKLTKLPKIIQNAIAVGEISENHGKALLGLEDEQAMVAALKIVVRNGHSAARTEELVRQIKAESQSHKKSLRSSPTLEWETKYNYIKDEINQNYGWDVKLKRKKDNGGAILINFSNEDELVSIYKKLTGKEK